MSRHTGFPATTGYPRTASHVNTFWSELVTKSAAVDQNNLAPEGLDIRNFGDSVLFAMETSGSRLYYVENNTAGAFAGASATYRSEPTTAMVLGAVNVELDWGAGLAIASDEYLVIKGTVACGTPTLPGLRSNPAGVGALMGASAVILLDVGAGYVVQNESRHGRYGRHNLPPSAPPVAPNVATFQADSFDLTPMLIVGSGTVVKMAIGLGYTLPGANDSLNVNRAQLHAYLVKKCR